MGAKLTARAASVLNRMVREGTSYVPQHTSDRIYITQAALVRSGHAQWLPSNLIAATDKGRAALEAMGIAGHTADTCSATCAGHTPKGYPCRCVCHRAEG